MVIAANRDRVFEKEAVDKIKGAFVNAEVSIKGVDYGCDVVIGVCFPGNRRFFITVYTLWNGMSPSLMREILDRDPCLKILNEWIKTVEYEIKERD